jgi:hypothetical protein
MELTMNNTYKISLSSPVLRAGLSIETTCSERYVVAVTHTLMDMARDINKSPEVKNKESNTIVETCKWKHSTQNSPYIISQHIEQNIEITEGNLKEHPYCSMCGKIIEVID